MIAPRRPNGPTAVRLCYAITLALAPWPLYGQEYDSLPAAPSASLAVQDRTLYLTLIVNGREDNQIVPVHQQDKHFLVEAGALARNFIKLTAAQQGLIDITRIPDVKVEYDEPGQRLLLTVPDSWLPTQTISNRGIYDKTTALSHAGLLVNYDIYTQSAQNQRYLSAWLEQRWFNQLGYLSNTGTWWQPFSGNQDERKQHYLRYDTYWRYSNETSMINIQVGDIVSNALTWSNAVRMGGLRISRDFTLRPDIITWPLLQYSGTAAVPGSVDLFINGYKASSSDINAGPFSITNVPYINGAGEATVVTTDALGRQVSTSVPFYVSNSLLRQGLSDFDFSAGALRWNYGIDNANYDTGAVSGIYRYGVWNWLTLSTHGEASDHLTVAGLGSDIAVGNWGTFSQSVSQSHASGGQGRQYSLAYSYYSRAFGFSAQHLQRNPSFRDLSVAGTDISLSQQSDQFTVSTAPFNGIAGSFGLGYFNIRAADGSRTRLGSLSWSRGMAWNSSLYFTVNKTLGESGYSAMLQWSLPLAYDNTATVSTQRNTGGDYSPRTTLTRAAPTQGGLGWNLAWGGGTSDYRQADLEWRTPYSTLKGGFWQQDNQTTGWADTTGSLIVMDNALFATNKVNDSFLLVSTNGYPDVPVRYENQLIGRTDSQGHVLIPWASAWYPSKVEIVTLDLPVDVEAPVVEKNIAVRAGSGAMVSFPVNKVRSAALLLIDSKGEPLPPGGAVTELNSGQTAMVGYGGEVWLNHITAKNSLVVDLGGGQQCRVNFTLSEADGGYATLGKRHCLPPDLSSREPSL